FREYDVRGVVDRDLTEEVVEAIGRGFGTFLRRREMSAVSIGRDVRASSPVFREALVRGLVAAGMDVTDVGICPTPLLYFALDHYDTPGGVMITGSHNPPDMNGLKLCAGKVPIFGDEIQELAEIVRAEDFVSGEGSLRQAEIVAPYLAYLKGNVRIERALKVVIDAGNGVAGTVAPALMEMLGQQTTELFCDPDPS
ncbi:MAG: phosphomannomutase, partial [Nitrospina sp.]|nr:phosphomannomutase [Nitrospina sp.]